MFWDSTSGSVVKPELNVILSMKNKGGRIDWGGREAFGSVSGEQRKLAFTATYSRLSIKVKRMLGLEYNARVKRRS